MDFIHKRKHDEEFEEDKDVKSTKLDVLPQTQSRCPFGQFTTHFEDMTRRLDSMEKKLTSLEASHVEIQSKFESVTSKLDVIVACCVKHSAADKGSPILNVLQMVRHIVERDYTVAQPSPDQDAQLPLDPDATQMSPEIEDFLDEYPNRPVLKLNTKKIIDLFSSTPSSSPIL